ncbi:hypothetical protein Kpol_473p12 [Vanderwaltozyma polyspora DSM 70294]|uniref:TIGR01456 family HAD hydrolase n=1 Tax=Vanderwaltozyma polyspora (strain ATCC 22028 / DSM 70294 / BCRC 21397 / CBS 2163 / NBRC 10782 / NRRL Y-8283 / UCD 57-17) TaxID=436907 RepID=A7TQ04_VANPO|nr:uncharacterized protein Kpol_473p12 [Vanderwaltozyma polyspora DSM 70294]EDO15653.1 hypothetical protein Kpol_473p12 [Vanderwaltozyma polyspora DSM 70294]
MVFKRLLHSTKKNIAFAFDIDGVLLRSKTPIPGAGDALRLLNKNNIPYILLTNGGGSLEYQRAEFLSNTLDVAISPDQVILSHTPYRTLANKYNKILAIGTPSVREVAKSYGFKNVVHQTDIIRYNKFITPFTGLSNEQLLEYSQEIPDIDTKKFDAVLVFNDPHDWAADIQIITDLLNTNNGMLNTLRNEQTSKPSIPIYFSNNDLLWANGYSLNRFGQGAFRFLVRELYSRLNKGLALEDTVIGKPTKITYDFAHNVLIAWRENLLNGGRNGLLSKLPNWGEEAKTSPFDKVYMIGDNPASDIIGAYKYGWESCLVRTGVYRDGDKLDGFKPTYTVDNVYDAVTKALEGTI